MRTEYIDYSNDIGFIWVRPHGRICIKGATTQRQIHEKIKAALASEGVTDYFRVQWHKPAHGRKPA